jgi:uncharacterized protein
MIKSCNKEKDVTHAPISGTRKAILALFLVILMGTAPRAFAQEPTQSQIAMARSLVSASGMTRSFDSMIPQMQDQLTQTVTRTRPEIAKDVTEALTQIKPELDQKRDEFVTTVARIFAKHMSDQEMKDSVAFFTSASGKKYVADQPVVLDEVVVAMDGWTRSLSDDVLALVRAQLKKKNIEF